MKRFRAIDYLVSSYIIVCSWSLLLVLGSGVLADVSDSQRDNDVILQASSEACTVMHDGTCLVTDEGKPTNANTTNTLPVVSEPLPEVDASGYVITNYGEKQQILGGDTQQNEKTKQRLIEMHNYMHGDVYVKGPHNLRNDCLNRNELCTFWASVGECTANPGK
jgi:hypothetical protein